MTPEEIKEAQALCKKATSGPWRCLPEVCTIEGMGVYNEADMGCIVEVGDPYPRGNNRPTENLQFIAKARTLLPQALDALEEAHREIAQLKAHVCSLRCSDEAKSEHHEPGCPFYTGTYA